jgi:hypothetical protein
MKNYYNILIVLMLCFLYSCTKDYTCKCSYISSMTNEMELADSVIINDNRLKAEDFCNQKQMGLQLIYEEEITCKIY